MVSKKSVALLVVSRKSPFVCRFAIIFVQGCLRIYTFIISDPLTKFRKWKFRNFGRKKGVPPLQQDFHQDFRSFPENSSFPILTILKIGKDLILHKKWSHRKVLVLSKKMEI